jgi:hypothetical protein
MIKELIPLLTTHRLDFRTEVKDQFIHIYVIPKVLNEKMDEKDKQVLERPLFKKYGIDKFTNEQLVEDITGYANVMIEGTNAIEEIDKEIKARIEEKKKPATKAKAKAKPTPRKTKKQEMDEAREKQAKEREEQGDLFSDEPEDRLGEKKEEKTPVKNKEELKTAAEKAVERVTQSKVLPSAEEEAEAIATAVDNKESDPFGLDDLEL